MISLITPTADQPLGMALLERYIARQTVQPDQWIVADDGLKPAKLTMSQVHLVRPRRHEGGRSLAGNLLAALEQVSGEFVLIAEHDDHYSPNHIEVCVEHLQNARATGSLWQRYYHVPHRCHITLRNSGSALCNTAFRAELIPAMRAAAEKAFRQGVYSVDRFFWESPEVSKGRGGDIHPIHTVVGIKGLPGRPGLGMGHRPDHRRAWVADPTGVKLREWIGQDADHYLLREAA